MKNFSKKFGLIMIFVLCFSLIIFSSVKISKVLSVNAEENDTSSDSAEHDKAPGEGDKSYTPVSLNFTFEKTIDGLSEGFNRDMSVNQFAFCLTVDDGTDKRDSCFLLPRDTPDTDDPETKYKEGPGSVVANVSFDKPGSYTVKVREINPSEGLTDDEGRPMPYETPGMQYDDSEYEETIVVKDEGGNLVIYEDIFGNLISLIDGSFLPLGDFNNISSDPNIKSAVTRINNQAGTIEFTQGHEYTVTSDVELEKLADGEVYTVESLLFKDYEPFDTVISEVRADNLKINVTFAKKATEADVYRVVTILKKGDERLRVYNGNFIIDNDVTLKAPREIPPEDPTVAPTESQEESATDSTDESSNNEGDESSEPSETSDGRTSTQGETSSNAKEKSSSKKSTNADTGDKGNIWPFVIIIAAAGAGIAVTSVFTVTKRRKR